jgi:hypothetical protein
MMFLFEALEKAGRPDAIVQSILTHYRRMLEEDATTVWETFPGWESQTLTRSHCHAWSAAPLYFLPRVILGIRQAEAGGAAYVVSPRLNGLAWARGAVATARGRLAVDWTIRGRELLVRITAPAGVKVRFMRNETMRGYTVKVQRPNTCRGS